MFFVFFSLSLSFLHIHLADFNGPPCALANKKRGQLFSGNLGILTECDSETGNKSHWGKMVILKNCGAKSYVYSLHIDD